MERMRDLQRLAALEQLEDHYHKRKTTQKIKIRLPAKRRLQVTADKGSQDRSRCPYDGKKTGIMFQLITGKNIHEIRPFANHYESNGNPLQRSHHIDQVDIVGQRNGKARQREHQQRREPDTEPAKAIQQAADKHLGEPRTYHEYDDRQLYSRIAYVQLPCHRR